MQRFGIRSVRQFSSAARLNTRYGFVGLGAMGLNMARNIGAKMDPKNDSLAVFDLNKEACQSVEGASVAESAGAVAQACDVVVTMLPEGKHVRAVYEEMVKAATKNDTNKTFIDCSTSDVASSLHVAQLVADSALGSFVDAPVSGGTVGALNGTLTFMVGAPEIEGQLETTLSMMGARVFACGKAGAGLAAKLANNYILALTNIATSEGFHLASALGLDAKVFSSIVNVSSGRSWSSEINTPVPGILETAPSSRDYDNGFATALMKKDLLLAIDAGKLAKAELPLGAPAAGIYSQLCDDGYARKDLSVLYKVLQETTKK